MSVHLPGCRLQTSVSELEIAWRSDPGGRWESLQRSVGHMGYSSSAQSEWLTVALGNSRDVLVLQ